MIILLLNFSVNRQLEQLVIEVEDLSDTFSSRKDIIADVTKVNDRIATYKSIESKRSLISRHAEVMNTDVPKGFYSSTSFDTDKANLNIVVSEPINASIYMSNLFSNKDIESISLLYAGLNRGGSYDISIEVTYK
ncbi:hypothetical protein H6802_02530 [Candidatus Nomurabacteria bacterium]|nr:hypothetical protein [Candidatus Nomurabacteria bacterium]MCB9826784.1 hypothetical protein [Candidatus Nomurabacteria bacterium]MCB9827605.1 hypothetical protein [Candidatus Nomurabacteria bacterium]HXK52607.1 hypothetical protein [bacterium]